VESGWQIQLSGNPQAQWNITIGQTLLEKRRRGPSICRMCHKNPAEFSGYRGDCYSKLKSRKEAKTVTQQ
jgi:hypothetical protein